jgi:mono/diheme cytochrome c family protein
MILLGLLAGPRCAAAQMVSYNEHIRPILADNCFACHGSDATHREADLRLDTSQGATQDREGIPAISPRDLAKSEVWRRINSSDESDVMPPPDSHKPPLTAHQRALIKKWIEQGAAYQSHWAFAPIVRPPIPNSKEHASAQAIDLFVEAKLTAHGLTPSPRASREVLIRRVTLDLIGLPPTTEEVDAFLADGAADAFERVVDRLLASPHYGEHFGRYWLDAVRYGDTHGLHNDNVRTIWPYRDWVVAAFNRNLPFDEFTIEQLAGDMLPNPDVDQLVASGYNRNPLTTSESGTIEAEAEKRLAADRIDTTAAVWLGLTANCASCHDHKFDPLTQKEYYALAAIFKGLSDRVWDGDVRVADPVVIVAKDAVTQSRIEKIAADVKLLEQAVTARADELITGGVRLETADRTPITYEVIWAEDEDLPTPQTVMAPSPPGKWTGGAHVPVVGGRRALRLEGNVRRSIAFTAGDVPLIVRKEVTAFVHVRPDVRKPPQAISVEFISNEKTKRMVWGDAAAFGPSLGEGFVVVGPMPPAGQYARLELRATDCGLVKGKEFTGVRMAQADGAALWDQLGAVVESPSRRDDPLISARSWSGKMRERARGTSDIPVRHDIKFLLGLSRSQSNEDDEARLETYHRDFVYGQLRAALEPQANAARRLMAEQIHYETTLPMSPISGERAVPPPAHVLIRGAYDAPGEIVQPGTPAFLPPLHPSGERATRLDFARWLVNPNHPLTARVIVNRLWAQLFGAGLVRTPGDFGVQGAPPTHPELLDWLASEFIRTGWDVKRLVRRMVLSRTYQQQSRMTPASAELDPENKLLARGPRQRLDAEVLRDQALAMAGLLRTDIGGPPVRPYQPPNVWEPLGFEKSNTKNYVQDHGNALYRRSLYTLWKRTAPPPSMSTFDAPSREVFCVARGRSNTPLQALALMNDVQQVEAARALAERLLEHPGNDRNRCALAFRTATARMPTPEEVALLDNALAKFRARFQHDRQAARQYVHNGESVPNPELPVGELAAWTSLANLLLNMDETITKN